MSYYVCLSLSLSLYVDLMSIRIDICISVDRNLFVYNIYIYIYVCMRSFFCIYISTLAGLVCPWPQNIPPGYAWTTDGWQCSWADLIRSFSQGVPPWGTNW